VGGAIAGASPPARFAGPAGDLKRQHRSVAGPEGRDGVADSDDFHHSFVAERIGTLEGEAAVENADVEVAGGHNQGTDEGGVGPTEYRLVHLLPTDDSRSFEDEL